MVRPFPKSIWPPFTLEPQEEQEPSPVTAPPPQTSTDLAGQPDLSPSNLPVTSAQRPDATMAPMGPPPVPPTMVEVPSDRPKGFGQIFKRALLGAIPGFNVGYEAARTNAEQKAAARNAFNLKIYSDQLQAQRNEQMQAWREGQLKEKYDSFNELMARAVLASNTRLTVAQNQLQKHAMDMQVDRSMAEDMVDRLYPELTKPGKEQDREQAIAVWLKPAIRDYFDPGGLMKRAEIIDRELKALGDPGLSTEQYKRLSKIAPPVGPQPSATYGWVGPDLQGNFTWGLQSQRVPGVAPQAAPAIPPTPAPAAAPYEPITLKAAPAPGTIPDAETARKFASLAAQTGQDENSLRTQLNYAPKAAVPVTAAPAMPQKVHPSRLPTTVTRTKAEQAGVVIGEGNRLIAEIEKARNVLGPLVGRISRIEQGIGSADPTVSTLYTHLRSFAALQPALHGSRGIGMQKEFEDAVGDLPRNPDALIASIKSLMGTAEAFRKAGHPQGNQPIESPPASPEELERRLKERYGLK